MALELYEPRRQPARKPLVTVHPKGFRFSAESVRRAGLESAHWVRILFDEEERLIAFEFLDDPSQPDNAVKLLRFRGLSRSCKVGGLIKKRWIKQVAEDDPRNRKFRLVRRPHDRKLWGIRLAHIQGNELPRQADRPVLLGGYKVEAVLDPDNEIVRWMWKHRSGWTGRLDVAAGASFWAHAWRSDHQERDRGRDWHAEDVDPFEAIDRAIEAGISELDVAAGRAGK